jgi:phenylalanyl-tRNA synthetase alpha chain
MNENNGQRNNFRVSLNDQKTALADIESLHDPENERIKKFLKMSDLSRTSGSPIAEMVERILDRPEFKEFDIIETPEVVPASISFDLFDFPKDHPARSRSDTYYVNDENILRTHTTVMWYYYLNEKDVQGRMSKGEAVGCFSFGKVYRKDEIDRNHMNVFHQLDGWYLAPKDKEMIGEEELKKVLSAIAEAVFGAQMEKRFNPDQFPYTDPSLEMEIKPADRWIEVLGSGVVKGSVLDKLGIDSSKWNGWAFGFGLERLAIVSMDLPDIRLLWSDDERVKKQLKLGTKFKEVSKFPPVIRDISFIAPKSLVLNQYFDRIRDIVNDQIEEVKLIDKYENDGKFGSDKMSYTWRLTYRHLNRTLTNEEVNALHAKVEEMTEKEFNASVRRE